MRLRPEDKETVYHACLLVVGPEPLNSTGVLTMTGATRVIYLQKILGFYRAQDISEDPWPFIYWQRQLRLQCNRELEGGLISN